MSRDEFSRSVKLARWDHCAGRCEGCGVKLSPGKFDYDHDIPAKDKGPATFENCRVLCKLCHGIKTGQDRKNFAKVDSMRAKNLGIRKASFWPCGKQSKLKKLFNGQIVPRR